MWVLILILAVAAYFIVNPSAASDVEAFVTGSRLTPQQIATVASIAGFTGDDLATAVAIALAESSGNPAAVGDAALAPTRGPSIGLWQINTGSAAHPEYAGVDLTDPQTNANAAYSIYLVSGFRPWSTYTSGAYAAYLESALSGIANV
jgi:soluble lytic murein transglycosylase-like protein